MIVTVTLNAALDRTLNVPNFQPGTRNRASEAITLPGGKGINVARALKTLGEPGIATGLAGGRAGTSIVEGLTEEGILNDFVRIRGESRSSTAVLDPNGLQTEIIEHGPSVNQDELELFIEKVRYLARGADLFVLAGSLPGGVPTDFYARLLAELSGKVLTALDTHGPPLRAGLAGAPNLASPNAREAEEIAGYEFSDDTDLADAAATLTSLGADSAIVHLSDGCVARLREAGDKEGATFRASLVERTAISTVGSGDALLAGYLTGLVRGEPPVKRLEMAVACGAANALRAGAGIFALDDFKALQRQVRVTEMAQIAHEE